MYFLFNKNKTLSELTKPMGFTLLELMVTVSIGLVILATVVGSQSKYTDAAALKGIANDISLSLRQSQTYGISVKEFKPGNSDFSAAYGLYFDTAYTSSYIYFGDKGLKNGYYDGPAGACDTTANPECISLISIANNIKIQSICTVPLGSQSCNTANVSKAFITYVRPATTARIDARDTNGVTINSAYKGVRIVFVSPKGATRAVTVYTTGYISVQ